MVVVFCGILFCTWNVIWIVWRTMRESGWKLIYHLISHLPFVTLFGVGEIINMMDVAWMVLFGGIDISVIGCGIVDLLEDYSDEKRRRNI